jgi:uncharacterized protein
VAGNSLVRTRIDSGALVFGEGAHALRVELGATQTDQQPWWQPVRTLAAAGYTVRLEDADPYRHCHHWTPERRLSDSAAQRWQEYFAGAVTVIGEELAEYEDGLRCGLSTLMPIEPQRGRGDASAAARYAFGAVGAALPATPALLALLLLHEFQHVKLGAVLDLYELFDKSDTADKYYAPWRPDPRPLEGLLQGAYAHIAVTDFWRVRRHSAGNGDAEMQFARWRVHTAEAMEVLLTSGSLTPLGTRFVEAMRETVQPWCDEPVSAAALDAAHRASATHRAEYLAAMSKS